MFTIYVYVLETLADWELGYVTSELHSGRFFKKDAERVSLKTVSYSKEPIHTMGGLTVIPDCLIDDVVVSETSVLLLPGADTWNDPKHGAIINPAIFAGPAQEIVGLLLHLLILDCWIIVGIPVMDRVFLKCFHPPIKDRVSILTSHL